MKGFALPVSGAIKGALAAVVLFHGPAGNSETVTAVIRDPDGYTNIRREPDKASPVVGKIREGERFITTGGEEWWEVYSPSGRRGFVHKSRIRVLKNEFLPRLAFRREDVVRSAREIPEFAEAARDYPQLVESALSGSDEGLLRLYDLHTSISLDGAAAEVHQALLWEVLHLTGDARFASFLKKQSPRLRGRLARISEAAG